MSGPPLSACPVGRAILDEGPGALECVAAGEHGCDSRVVPLDRRGERGFLKAEAGNLLRGAKRERGAAQDPQHPPVHDVLEAGGRRYFVHQAESERGLGIDPVRKTMETACLTAGRTDATW